MFLQSVSLARRLCLPVILPLDKGENAGPPFGGAARGFGKHNADPTKPLVKGSPIERPDHHFRTLPLVQGMPRMRVGAASAPVG